MPTVSLSSSALWLEQQPAAGAMIQAQAAFCEIVPPKTTSNADRELSPVAGAAEAETIPAWELIQGPGS